MLTQAPFIVPIPGTTKIPNLETNLAAADIRLSAAEMAELGALLAPEKVAGGRYTPAQEGLTGR